MKSALARLKAMDAEIHDLNHIEALLSWDQETGMPALAVEERSRQLSLIAGLIHERITSEEAGRLLEKLGWGGEAAPDGKDLPVQDRAFLREFSRRYRRKVRVPKKLAVELARQGALAQNKWVEARESSDFSIFSPSLGTVVGLVRELASALGYREEPYDPLLDEYEPYMKTRDLEKIFASFLPRLQDLVTRITAAGRGPDTSFLSRSYPLERQELFGRRVLETMGYDFSRGRLDISAHPFTSKMGTSDVRLTTRYNPNYFNTGIFGSIHEGGHGIYEQGADPGLAGTLLADGASLGLHESQSRMYENLIGRSLSFWKHFYPQLSKLFPDALSDIDLETFYRGINAVHPSLIRVEADEVTYNLHIVMRFNLEKALLEGSLAVGDLPAAWNEQSRNLLGLVPPGDAEGVLQDIHWCWGAIGYFPTYTLGNLFSAQFYAAMKKDLPGLEEAMAGGDLEMIRAWLGEKIHRPGKLYPAGELCSRVSGEELNPAYFMDYLETKYTEIYGL
jgi:carboxypeptidase Taq